MWRVKLGEPARVQHQDPAAIYDRVQPVRDGKHSAVSEGGADGCLDEPVCAIVYVGGSLVLCTRQASMAAYSDSCTAVHRRMCGEALMSKTTPHSQELPHMCAQAWQQLMRVCVCAAYQHKDAGVAEQCPRHAE